MVGYVADACHMSGQGEEKSMSITFNVPRTSCHSSVDNPAVTVSRLLMLPDAPFVYILTARFGQDPLEHFFGLLRHAADCEDHPLPPCLFSCIAYCQFTVCCGYLVCASVAIRIINCVTPNSVLPQ